MQNICSNATEPEDQYHPVKQKRWRTYWNTLAWYGTDPHTKQKTDRVQAVWKRSAWSVINLFVVCTHVDLEQLKKKKKKKGP